MLRNAMDGTGMLGAPHALLVRLLLLCSVLRTHSTWIECILTPF